MRLRRMIQGTGRATPDPSRPAFDPCRPHQGSVAQLAELPPLKRRVAGSTPAGATFGRAAIGAVSRLENGWAFGPWGFDSLSFRFVEAWPSWKGSALLALVSGVSWESAEVQSAGQGQGPQRQLRRGDRLRAGSLGSRSATSSATGNRQLLGHTRAARRARRRAV
jgi:hypothetical protein